MRGKSLMFGVTLGIVAALPKSANAQCGPYEYQCIAAANAAARYAAQCAQYGCPAAQRAYQGYQLMRTQPARYPPAVMRPYSAPPGYYRARPAPPGVWSP